MLCFLRWSTILQTWGSVLVGKATSSHNYNGSSGLEECPPGPSVHIFIMTLS